MQVKNLLLLGFVALVLIACADSAVKIISPEASAKFGFNVTEESVFKNPPVDRARVHIVRQKQGFLAGAYGWRKFPVYFLYGLPATYMDDNNITRITEETQKDIVEKTKNNTDSYIGLLSSGASLMKDFEVGQPLFFRFLREKTFADVAPYPILWPLYWLQDDQSDFAFMSFTPEAGKIYCLEVIGLKYNYVVFIDKQACEKFFLDKK